MTADARRHHPAAEKTPKISATGALASPNLADRYGRSRKPAAQFLPACGWP